MKKQILFIIALLISVTIYSQTFVDNNITYNITSTTTVEITSYNTAGGTDVVIPASVTNASTTYAVTSIGNLAFFNKGLTSVEMPNTITNIGNVAFRVNLLTNITIPNSVITIGSGAFVSNPQLTSVVFGNNVSNIGASSFGGCALTHLVFPDSVTTIGSSAFGNNQLQSITFGAGVTTIGSLAFTGNTSTLNTVVSKATTPPSITTDAPSGNSDTFNIGGDRSGIDLFIPSGTTAAYLAADWTDFVSVTETSSNVITFDTQGHTSGQILSNPYTITNGGETFSFTISGGSATNHIYRTSETSCGASGMSHIYSGNTSQTTWTIETTSGNEIDLGNIRFDNVFACFSFIYNLTIEGFKNNISTGTQMHTVSGLNSIFSSNSNFNDVDKIVITATDLANLGLDDINWEASISTPTITTTAPNSVAYSSAILAGNITDNGGEAVIERGIVYSKTVENADPLIGGANVIKDTNGAGVGSFSESISNLSAGTQYSHKAYATNSVGTSYGSVTTFTTTGKGWTGATNSDWATASNWSPSSIPITSDNIVIQNSGNQPVINTSTGAVANNLEIQSNASLTVQDGGSLIIGGTATGNITYSRNINFVSGNSNGWYLMASPVIGETFDDAYVTANSIAANGNNRGIATYLSASDTWSYLQSGSNGTFNNGQGYSIKRGTSSGNVSFIGTLNTNDLGTNVVLSTTGNRFNLMGNPYISYVNSATFLINEASISDTKTCWVWNQTLSTNGAYEVKIISDNFTIAPGQGFFVQANSGGGTFNFSEANQMHSGTDTFQKTTNNGFKLLINDGTIYNYAKIHYLSSATKGFDVGYDGELFSANSNSFAIYTHLLENNQGKRYQVQSLPNSDLENMIIPIGINAAAGKEITFTIEDVNLPNDIKVFIEDRQTNVFTQLDNANSNYTITLSEELNDVGRFYMHTTSSVLNIKDVSMNNISIYKFNDTNLRVSGLKDSTAKINIFNMIGQKVMQTSFYTNSTKDISLTELKKGVYFVQLITKNGKLNKKIILN